MSKILHRGLNLHLLPTYLKQASPRKITLSICIGVRKSHQHRFNARKPNSRFISKVEYSKMKNMWCQLIKKGTFALVHAPTHLIFYFKSYQVIVKIDCLISIILLKP